MSLIGSRMEARSPHDVTDLDLKILPVLVYYDFDPVNRCLMAVDVGRHYMTAFPRRHRGSSEELIDAICRSPHRISALRYHYLQIVRPVGTAEDLASIMTEQSVIQRLKHHKNRKMQAFKHWFYDLILEWDFTDAQIEQRQNDVISLVAQREIDYLDDRTRGDLELYAKCWLEFYTSDLRNFQLECVAGVLESCNNVNVNERMCLKMLTNIHQTPDLLRQWKNGKRGFQDLHTENIENCAIDRRIVRSLEEIKAERKFPSPSNAEKQALVKVIFSTYCREFKAAAIKKYVGDYYAAEEM